MHSASNLSSKDQTQIEMPPEFTCLFPLKENNIFKSKQRPMSASSLSMLSVLYLMVVLVKIMGAVKANSLAIMTDAAHLLTDVVGFSISLLTVRASAGKAVSNQSFGFRRLEVLGGLVSAQLIWLISPVLIYVAIERILNENEGIKGALMFGIAEFGFAVKLVMVIWLGHDRTHHQACGDRDHHQHHHHRHHDLEKGKPCHLTEENETSLMMSSPEKTKIWNINLQGAYFHVMSDLIQSVGMMIAAAVIWRKPTWLMVDLLYTVFFSAVALITTLPVLRDNYGILMERTPRGINIDMLESGIKGIKGVQNIHDLHVWAITVGEPVLHCHVVAEPGVNSNDILSKIKDYCEKTYKIRHMTVQIE
ncbi:hypothetical protein DITRI_Ditri14bG0065300 [Diplodiscus trichospermus]